MNQRTHAWLAIRALALLDDLGQVRVFGSISCSIGYAGLFAVNFMATGGEV